MKKLRFGVVGVGYIGALHAQKYAAMEDIDLAGLADIDFKRAKEMAGKYNTKAYSSHTELLRNVDGVSLAVPTISHFEIARDILNHGTHLLIEKPITLSIRDADNLIKLANDNNIILQTGHIERFNPAIVKMKQFLSNPIYIESQRLSSFTKRGTDVDVVLDLMIHDLDIILHIVNSDIKEIDAFGAPVMSNRIDIANVKITFSNGTIANLTANRYSHESIRAIRVLQLDNYISVDYSKRKLSITKIKKNGKNFDQFSSDSYKENSFPDSDPLSDQIKSFIDSIKNGTEPKVSGVDGRNALSAALSIVDQIEKKYSQLHPQE